MDGLQEALLKRRDGTSEWINLAAMKENLENFLNHITRLGGDSRQLIFERPALAEEVDNVEKMLKYQLPDDFRDVLLMVSSHCEFKWFLPKDFKLPKELRGIFCGEIHWGLEYIVQFNEDRDRWVKDVFPNPNDEYDKVWHNKFVFQEVGNGDFLSIDLSAADYGKVIYLSHDDGEGHGYVMANSFYELLHNWPQLGCVGAEDWQWLPFCEDKHSGINPQSPNAIQWKKTIRLI
jgi:cell wall assembly regulator SMI1